MGEKLDRLLKKVGMTQIVMPKLVSASKEFDALGAPDTRSGRQEGFFNKPVEHRYKVGLSIDRNHFRKFTSIQSGLPDS
jgi:hypothetical protein